MSLIISILAIIISLSTFSFNLYQYRKNRNVSLLSKSNEILKLAYVLRRAVEDLRIKIGRTDDLDDVETEGIEALATIIDVKAEIILNSPKITLEELYSVEKSIISVDLEFSLFAKHIDSVIAFNEEVAAMKKIS